MDNVTGRTLQGYEVFDRIGSGGFGAVYRAYQSTLGREVAIKIILPGFANRPEFIRRFQVEAQLIARLEHLHIVPLYDFWRDPSGAYLVMRWLKGGNLKDALKEGSFDLKSTALFLDQIASGLSYAHANGVVHRDVKPGNILLDEEGNCYLSDFGIALDFRAKESGWPSDNILSLHPDYISPEQARNEPVKSQSDIYSLGIILYEVMAGQHPFPNTSPVERLFRHINDLLPEIETLHQEIREGVNAVIQKATAKNPKQRYQDALEMAAAFREAAKLAGGKAVSVIEDLTLREQKILEQILAGRTNREIAQALYVELSTVKWYVRQIYRKLGVRSRRQAVVRARESRLFSRDEGPGSTVETQADATSLTEVQPINPYKGLRAFEVADAREFFGREELVKKLLSRLAPGTQAWQRNFSPGNGRFLAVVGPSGSGKSSLIKAGLIAAIMRGEINGSERWFIAQMEPGLRPLDQLEVALVRLAADRAGNLREQLERDQFGLVRASGLILPHDGSLLLLVVDQFEEVFTLVQEESERARFLDLLSTAALEPNSRVRIVIALRADFYDRPLIYPVFGELVRNCLETVLPLSAEELERAILEPAKQGGVTFEPGLVTKIIEDVYYQPGALPMLQYALTELFEQRQDRLLTHAGYQVIGGASGALAKRAEELYLEMNDAGRNAIHQIFLRLVNFGDEASSMQQAVYTRRRALRSELLGLADEELIDEIVDTYARYRLLSLDHEANTRRPTVELAHEALLSKWERLGRLLDESREDLYTYRRLSALAREWEQAGRDPGYLLRGSRLDQFAGWADNTNLVLTESERAFISSSLSERKSRQAEEEARQQREIDAARKLAETEARRAQEQVRAARRLRWLAAGLAVFLIAAIGAAWLAFKQQKIAQANFITAERTRLAAQAQIALDKGEGGDLPALLALRSLQYGYSPEADAALLNALRRGFTLQRYLGHSEAIRSIEVSPDGRYVLTASADHTARLWEIQTGKEIRQFVGHTSLVNVATFSPDGRYILTGSADSTARLWDAQTGQELRQFVGHNGGVWGAAFSPDGQYVATGGNDTTARLWDAQSGREVRRFEGHTGVITWLAYSPDGRYVATGSEEKTARLWDAQTGWEVRRFEGHTDCACSVRFSPDGQYLLTSGADRTARLWEIQTAQEVRRFVGHTDFVLDSAFSPDGRYILTTSLDRTARLWDVTTSHEVRQFIGHTSGVLPAAFSPNGQYVLTGSFDRTARLWELRTETEPRLLDISLAAKDASGVSTTVLSPDGQYVLSSGSGQTVHMWDMLTGQLVHELLLNLENISEQALSPDNSYLLTSSGDGIALLWEVETGRETLQFRGHSGPIGDMVFSPDGRFVLTGGEDHTARLWEVETGREIRQFVGHAGAVLSVTFSSDGRFALTGGEDNTARLWEVETGREIHQFLGHGGPVRAVTFSPDGRYVLTGGNDNTARLWEAETGREAQKFLGHTDQVVQVAFSPDGRYALTGSTDQTARLWELQSGEIIRQFVGHTSSLLFVGFSPDGRYVLTGDTQSAYTWRTALEDIIAFTCTELSRDFTADERQLYNITDSAPTCSELTGRTAAVEPTWTPAPASKLVLAPQTEPTPEVIEIVFLTDAANIQFGAPMQDVYIDDGTGMIVRPQDLRAETLAQPLYRATTLIEPDFLEEPFEVGPFEKGEPLGLTLAEWLAASGRGTYTSLGNRAVLDLTFENLIPHGVYTLWCSEVHIPPNTQIIDRPCGAPDGSENTVLADAEGRGAIRLEIDVLPPSTEEIIMSPGLAFHSDGQTHGSHPGEFGYNVHVQLFYEFPTADDE